MTEDSKFKKLWERAAARMYTLVFEYKGRKFKIYCDHTDGIPLGFNYKCCLDIMTSDGTWHHIVDDKEVGADWVRSTYDEECQVKYNENAVNAFQEYVESIY